MIDPPVSLIAIVKINQSEGIPDSNIPELAIVKCFTGVLSAVLPNAVSFFPLFISHPFAGTIASLFTN